MKASEQEREEKDASEKYGLDRLPSIIIDVKLKKLTLACEIPKNVTLKHPRKGQTISQIIGNEIAFHAATLERKERVDLVELMQKVEDETFYISFF